MAGAGKWTIEVSQGGHPAWAQIKYEDQEIHGIHHRDLQDLHYAVGRAILEAKRALGPSHAHEVD